MRVLTALVFIAACGETRIDVADKIAAEAKRMNLMVTVTVGGGKFASAEVIAASRDDCSQLEVFARRITQPPDCARLLCKLPDGSTESLVAYDGIWTGGGGYFPKCAKE